MNIVVLSGSPKSDTSVTMQYIAFIRKRYPQHDFTIFHIAQQIRHIEQDEQFFGKIIEAVQKADGVVWAFPLYVFLVHSHYKRFIELLAERKVQTAFAGKQAAVFSTSIHFYDHTAQTYLHGICDDLNMNYYATYSAGMRDLFSADERENLLRFFQGYFDAIIRKAPAVKVFHPLVSSQTEYIPESSSRSLIDNQGRKIVIVTDAAKQNVNLTRMTARLAASFTQPAEIVNLRDITIAGGCLGCIRCGYDNTCCYAGKDGFIDFYNEKIKKADILVFAGAIQDRYLSSLWKTFFDRGFFNTHIPTLAGKQVAFLISGPFNQLPNLRQIFEGYAEWQQANLVGIVSDEASSDAIDGALQELAWRSVDYAKKNYCKPATFLGIGGRKIFRDEIWGHLRFPFAADHHFYQQTGKYDFPQTEYLVRFRNVLFSMLIRIPFIRKQLYGKLMLTKMIEPYQKVVAKH